MLQSVHFRTFTLCTLAAQAASAGSSTCLFTLLEDGELTTLNEADCGEHQDGLSLLQLRARKTTTPSRLAKAVPARSDRVSTAAAVPVSNSSLAQVIAPVGKMDIRPFARGNQRLSVLLLQDRLAHASTTIKPERWLTYTGSTTSLIVCLACSILAYVGLVVCVLWLANRSPEKVGEARTDFKYLGDNSPSQLPAGQALLGRCAQDSYSRPAGWSPHQSAGAMRSALTEPGAPPTASPSASQAHPAKAKVAHAAAVEEAATALEVSEERSRSPLCPNVDLPPTRCLLISAVASDSRMRGPFDVFWTEDGVANGPRFRLHVREAGHADMLELCEVKPGSRSTGWLFGTSRGSLPPCAKIGPGRSKLSNYLVSNMQANMQTSGLSYRQAKDLSAKMSIVGGLVPWNSVVVGAEDGDGWLKVGDHFLPMWVNGVPVVFSMDSVASSQLSITDADGEVCAVLKPQAVGPTVGQFRVEIGGQVAMVLSTGEASSRLEIHSAQGAHVAAISHHRKTAMGQELIELSLAESTDPLLVLLCSIAVLRRLVM